MPTSVRYPLNELDTVTKSTRVKFTAIETASTQLVGSVMLYMPPGLSFGDQASYGTFDMGILGIDAEKLMKAGSQALGDSKEKLSAAWDAAQTGDFKAIGSLLASSVDKDIIGSLATYAARNSSQYIRDLIRYNSKKVQNPHTHTLFNNVEIRTFSFNFRMMAESEQESQMILVITNFFRQYLYPEVADEPGFLNKFPVTWDIKFLYGTGVENEENPWIPRIHRSFLTGCTTTINSDTNAFHKNGAPSDVSVSLSFMETKQYDRNTILYGTEADNTAPAPIPPQTPPATNPPVTQNPPSSTPVQIQVPNTNP